MTRTPPTTLVVPLACSVQSHDGKSREISIWLQRDSPSNQVWYRLANSDLEFHPRKRYFSNFGVYLYEYFKVRVSLWEPDIVSDGEWTLENWPSIWRFWRVVLAFGWFELNWRYAQYLNVLLGIDSALLAFWIWVVVTFGWTFCDKSFWYYCTHWLHCRSAQQPCVDIRTAAHILVLLSVNQLAMQGFSSPIGLLNYVQSRKPRALLRWCGILHAVYEWPEVVAAKDAEMRACHQCLFTSLRSKLLSRALQWLPLPSIPGRAETATYAASLRSESIY